MQQEQRWRILWPCLPVENIETIDLRTIRVPHTRNATEPESTTSEDLSIWNNSVVHLHGFVGRAASIDEHVILSELDYIRSRGVSESVLHSIFEGRPVILVGTSITDPPLLSALESTKDKLGPRRYAISARQSIRIESDDQSLMADLNSRMQDRMDQFGVHLVWSDFYSQVAQFLGEVQHAVEYSRPDKPYAGDWSGIRYGTRLTSWWTRWWDQRNKNIEVSQTADHKVLRDFALPEIRHNLGSESEHLKLELWVRWEPNERSRKMTRWASSTGTWHDADTMRNAEISASSEYAAIRAFCLGRAEIYDSSADSDRWKTYLCLPIRVAVDGGTIPVGVLALASMTPMKESAINQKNGAKVRKAIERVELHAQSLMQTGEPDS